MTILDEIISYKRVEVDQARKTIPAARLEKSKFFRRNTLKLKDYLTHTNKTGIIAEFKRKSPSKGIINADVTVEEVTTGYFRSGASALSILTDENYFGGTPGDLKRARELNPIPILRKDFIVDEYQIIEARAWGADAVLLIAAALDVPTTKKLACFAGSLELQVLLEVHSAEELDHLNEHVHLVGVNNRDLKTFTVDTELSVQLAPKIPIEFTKISESGIASPFTVKKLKDCGYQGFLIGESFMRTPDPAVAFSDFVKRLFFDS
jgi:indole-3-glycerol phosphate synthase